VSVPLLLRAAGRVGGLFGLANVDGLVGVTRFFEPRDLGLGEDFGWVDEFAGAGDEKVPWDVDVVVEVAVLEIELGTDVG
jgi:hypothetical protein